MPGRLNIKSRFIGYRLLATSYWLSVIGLPSSVFGLWSLVIGPRSSVTGHLSLTLMPVNRGPCSCFVSVPVVSYLKFGIWISLYLDFELSNFASSLHPSYLFILNSSFLILPSASNLRPATSSLDLSLNLNLNLLSALFHLWNLTFGISFFLSFFVSSQRPSE
jgi:hypothetical protein